MPNHVLHGTAFAAETNTSVEACKCYCMSAENRYSIECRSIEYYFNSRTCLISNLSRTTNPKNFNQFTASTLMHSYFDKTCSIQNNKFSIYMKEKCLSEMGLIPNDKNEIDNNGNDALHSDEVKNIHDNGNGIDLIASSMITTINPIHSIHYATRRSGYHDLSEEIGEENVEKKSREIGDLQGLNLAAMFMTTTISTGDFTIAADLFPELSDASAILGLFLIPALNFLQMTYSTN
ncbi:hypothetical protein LOAG_10880 [Loa loa]|uniref:Apple domain-containing protein n=1 Tax=Loa loa TaxID=7209 RepID=A0A1S0TQ84_LOALO|nr:hypothetical protein LOAG_10880 [Loa loa]EFO17617.1 hypothetical protein LOAG_10880 [Loa loa]